MSRKNRDFEPAPAETPVDPVPATAPPSDGFDTVAAEPVHPHRDDHRDEPGPDGTFVHKGVTKSFNPNVVVADGPFEAFGSGVAPQVGPAVVPQPTPPAEPGAGGLFGAGRPVNVVHEKPGLFDRTPPGGDTVKPDLFAPVVPVPPAKAVARPATQTPTVVLSLAREFRSLADNPDACAKLASETLRELGSVAEVRVVVNRFRDLRGGDAIRALADEILATV